MPPRIATANAFRPNSVPMSECTLASGAIMIPATPASSVEAAYAAQMTSGTLIPISRAASGFCTTASIAFPYLVLSEKAVSAAASDRPTAGIASCSQETWIPEIVIPPAKCIGKPRGSLPKVNSTALSATMPSATVAISQAFEPRRANGRTATSSTITPYSAHSDERERGGRQQRPAERDREGVGEHRAEHHRAALREVDRARYRVGDVEAEREQPVHAAQRRGR